MNIKLRTVIPMGIFIGFMGWISITAYAPKDFIGGCLFGGWVVFTIYHLKTMFANWDQMDATRLELEKLKREDGQS